MIARDLLIRFGSEYGYLKEFGLEILGVVINEPSPESKGLNIDLGIEAKPNDEVHPDHCAISLRHPFFFDN